MLAQKIANYVNNGSFEEHYPCLGFNPILVVKNWRSIDSSVFSGVFYNNICYGNIPWDGGGNQYPRTGNGFCVAGFYCPPPTCSYASNRGYFRNRLKKNLTKNQIYCVKYYVNVRDLSSHGINQASAYFCDDEIDSITRITIPLTYLIPQINFPVNQFITDTSSWTQITGTFVANGNEKHLIIGNFKSNASTDTVLINSSSLPMVGTDLFLEDVSCIPLDLPAYAGPDKSCKIGDSVYIGRELDFAIDPGCTWYKLPNMLTPFASSVSGLWVKQNAASTSTYVVKQILDCSALKYDTVVVYADLVGLNELKKINEALTIFPSPVADMLQINCEDLKAEKVTVQILNTIGETVLSHEFIFEDDKANLDVSKLPQGIYYLQVEFQDGVLRKKVVVER